jgi:hypothetical protein
LGAVIDELQAGRAAYAGQAWMDAHRLLSRAGSVPSS